jgi:hypothetical protein
VPDVNLEVRACAMTRLPERDRNVLIALGVLQRVVIDARARFDRDFISLGPLAETVTVFEGLYGPGDCG